MRLFFAIWPDAAERLEMERAQARLNLSATGRAIPPHNLHLTLCFLGEVAESQVEAIRCAAAMAAARTPGFPLRFDHLESWLQARAVVACAPYIAFAMHALVATLRAASAPERPEESFRPHVTLARNVVASLALPGIDTMTWQARAFHLVSSERHARGSVYTVLDTWSLLDKAASR